MSEKNEVAPRDLGNSSAADAKMASLDDRRRESLIEAARMGAAKTLSGKFSVFNKE